MSKNKSIAILRDAPVGKALWYLSLPAVLTTLVVTIHNLIDGIYVSKLNDNAMIAATTVALPVIVVAEAIGEGIGVGTASYLGRLLGAKEESKVERLIATAITLMLVITSILLAVFIPSLKSVIAFFTDDPMVIKHSYDYLIILISFSIFTIAKQIFSNMLRASGDVNYPMTIIIISIVLNIILNPIFMFDFGFGLKIKGAAIATAIAEIFAAFALCCRIMFHNDVVKWKFGHFVLCKESIKEIINVGIPVCIRNSLSSISYGLFAKSSGMFGTDFLAASGLSRKGEYFSRFVIMGVAQGYQSFAAYNYGAKNKQRLLDGLKMSLKFTIGYGFAMGAFFLFFPHVFMRILTSDELLISLGSKMLLGYAISVPFVAVYQIFAYNFQALGKGKLSFITSVLRQGVVYCPLITILPRLFGMTGMIVAQPICDFCSAMVVLILSRPIFKEIKNMEGHV